MGDLLVLMTFTVNQIEIDLNMSYIYKTKLTVPCRDSVSYLSKVCSRWRADLCKGCFAESSLISNNLKENVIECNWLWIIYREKVVVVGQIWWVIVLIEWMKEKKEIKMFSSWSHTFVFVISGAVLREYMNKVVDIN